MDYSLAELEHSSTKSDSAEDSQYIGGFKTIFMSDRFNQLFRFRILNHALFWVVIVFVSAYHGSLFGGDFWDNFINMLVICPVQMIAAYTLVYYQVPRLLLKGKWISFLIHFIGVGYISTMAARYLVIYVVEPIIGREGIDESLWEIISDPLYLLQVYTILVYVPVVILFLIKMTSERFRQEQHVQKLQAEKRRVELSFLKAQMNPHFLFNTLNNIYSLAKEKADETPEMIMKLSELLDYTIYDCQEEKVTIGKEWELIENYVDLQSMRFKNPLNIRLEAVIENEDVRIAPLILISLVENAFKYAMQTVSPKVSIELKANDQSIHMKVLNSKNAAQHKNLLQKGKKIGIKNLTGQLALMYPDRYQMVVQDEELEYEVNLNITI